MINVAKQAVTIVVSTTPPIEIVVVSVGNWFTSLHDSKFATLGRTNSDGSSAICSDDDNGYDIKPYSSISSQVMNSSIFL
jgi:hypothetical protein